MHLGPLGPHSGGGGGVFKRQRAIDRDSGSTSRAEIEEPRKPIVSSPRKSNPNLAIRKRIQRANEETRMNVKKREEERDAESSARDDGSIKKIIKKM